VTARAGRPPRRGGAPGRGPAGRGPPPRSRGLNSGLLRRWPGTSHPGAPEIPGGHPPNPPHPGGHLLASPGATLGSGRREAAGEYLPLGAASARNSAHFERSDFPCQASMRHAARRRGFKQALNRRHVVAEFPTAMTPVPGPRGAVWSHVDSAPAVLKFDLSPNTDTNDPYTA